MVLTKIFWRQYFNRMCSPLYRDRAGGVGSHGRGRHDPAGGGPVGGFRAATLPGDHRSGQSAVSHAIYGHFGG